MPINKLAQPSAAKSKKVIKLLDGHTVYPLLKGYSLIFVTTSVCVTIFRINVFSVSDNSRTAVQLFVEESGPCRVSVCFSPSVRESTHTRGRGLRCLGKPHDAQRSPDHLARSWFLLLLFVSDLDGE